MEYQKIINFLDNIPNQPTKFRTRNQDEINDQSSETYNVNVQVKFKTLCDCNNAYILVTATVTVPNTGTAANPNNRKI